MAGGAEGLGVDTVAPFYLAPCGRHRPGPGVVARRARLSSHHQDGYTLAESLAALIMIGLALGGVTAGMTAISRLQQGVGHSLQEGVGYRLANDTLQGFLVAGGPGIGATPGGLGGGVGRFDFDCGRAARCGGEVIRGSGALSLRLTGLGPDRTIPLPRLRDAHFIYVGARETRQAWPPAEPLAGERLRSLALVGETAKGDTPLAVARLWLEQPRNCQFDPISRACREAGS